MRAFTLAVAAALLASSVALAATPTLQSVTWTAGGTYSSVLTDGYVTDARYYRPFGVAVDPANNDVVCTDFALDVVFRITSAGYSSRFAGVAGSSGTTDGTSYIARFNAPAGVDCASSGTCWVADRSNHRVRELATDGTVSTLAGSSYGFLAGMGTAAKFYYPYDVAAVGTASVYVADYSNYRLRKVATSDKTVTTAAGSGSYGSTDGTGTSASFKYLTSVCSDSSGNLFVVDYSTIRKVTASSYAVTTLAGGSSRYTSADGTGTSAGFNTPLAIAVDSNGYLFVAEGTGSTSSKLRIVSSAGVVTTAAVPSGVSLYYTRGVAVTSSGGVYVSSYYGYSVAAMLGGTIAPGTTAAPPTTTTPPTDVPGSQPSITGSWWTAGSGSSQTKDGSFSAGAFRSPYGVAFDASNKDVVVTDSLDDVVRRVSNDGMIKVFAGTMGTGGFVNGMGTAAQFNAPHFLAVSATGVSYVCDQSNHAIRQIAADGTVTTLAGSTYGFADGTGTAAKFYSPYGVVSDGTNLYITDKSNYKIRKTVIATGATTTYSGGGYGIVNGALTRHKYPYGIARTSDGMLFVVDYMANIVRKVDSNGWASPLAGYASVSGATTIDGTGAAARFYNPYGIAVGPNNYLIVSQGWTSLTSKLRLVSPAGVVTTLTIPTGTSSLYSPKGVAVDATAGLFVANTGRDKVSGLKLTGWAGQEVATGAPTTTTAAPSTDDSSAATASAVLAAVLVVLALVA